MTEALLIFALCLAAYLLGYREGREQPTLRRSTPGYLPSHEVIRLVRRNK